MSSCRLHRLSAACESRVRPLGLPRPFSSSSSSSSTITSSPIVELREYALFPEHAQSFLKYTAETAELRTSHVPLRCFAMPETGGQLQVVTHAYYYAGGHAERDTQRALLANHPDWKAYILQCRPYAQKQSSSIYIEAPFLSNFPQVIGLSTIPSSTESKPSTKSILEIRRYQLQLGYDTVPHFLDYYQHGLPSKLEAPGTDPSTSLITLLYSDVGRLNEVIEVWRHGEGSAAMERSRHAARSATEWKQTIANIAPLATSFTSTIYKPLVFSPIQ
jgi:hypothetical protein